MLNIVLMVLGLLLPSGSQSAPKREMAQFRPCVWPNKCSKSSETAVLASVKPCVWPNRCGSSASADL